jgi:von Willebrand factor type A domain
MTRDTFSVEADYNRYLPPGGDSLYAILTVSAPAELVRSAGQAEIIIIDTSGSMGADRKLAAAKAAAGAAIDCLDDGVAFAVIAGTETATQVWPRRKGRLAVANAAERASARRAVDRLGAGGLTAMGRWLELARQLLEPATAELRHAVLLSDGQDTDETRPQLEATVERCLGVFSCDCRGVGTDWRVDDLRYIADTLHGREGMVGNVEDPAGQEGLVAMFREIVRSSQARAVPDLWLRVETREMADLGAVRQVHPKIVDLAGQAVEQEPPTRATEVPIGAWAPGEVRDYFVALTVRPGWVGQPGDRRRIAVVQVLRADRTVVASQSVEGVWTDDARRSTQVTAGVARHLAENELAGHIQTGVAALEAGDRATAGLHLGRAHRLAAELGDQDQLQRLDRLVHLDDSGTVDLRDSTKADRMQADTYSTTVPIVRRPSHTPPAD